jgi:hypothetical protein
MPSTYRIKDALSKLGSTAPFGVNADGVHAFECLRILTGTVNLEHKISGKKIVLRRCFLSEQDRKRKSNSLAEIVNRAFDSNFTMTEVSNYLNKTKPINRAFWENLKAELCLALACEHHGNSTEAFLHIYRILEMSSVALPLFYATAENDYKKALSFLKELPTNPRDGDLAIFRKFSQTLAREGGYSGHKTEIYYSKGDISWDQSFSDQVKKYVVEADNLTTIVDVPNGKIDVPFVEFPSFIVSFRNRLFHNTLSVENFDLDRLRGSNMTCEPIVRPALNWFTLSLCVILQQSMARHT